MSFARPTVPPCRLSTEAGGWCTATRTACWPASCAGLSRASSAWRKATCSSVIVGYAPPCVEMTPGPLEHVAVEADDGHEGGVEREVDPGLGHHAAHERPRRPGRARAPRRRNCAGTPGASAPGARPRSGRTPSRRGCRESRRSAGRTPGKARRTGRSSTGPRRSCRRRRPGGRRTPGRRPRPSGHVRGHRVRNARLVQCRDATRHLGCAGVADGRGTRSPSPTGSPAIMAGPTTSARPCSAAARSAPAPAGAGSGAAGNRASCSRRCSCYRPGRSSRPCRAPGSRTAARPPPRRPGGQRAFRGRWVFSAAGSGFSLEPGSAPAFFIWASSSLARAPQPPESLEQRGADRAAPAGAAVPSLAGRVAADVLVVSLLPETMSLNAARCRELA